MIERQMRLLQSLSVEVRFRRDQWVECLLLSGTETWLGRGDTEQNALASALAEALPSSLARGLFDRAVSKDGRKPEERASKVTRIHAVPSNETSPDAEDALERLDILASRIEDSTEELGLCAPERQRLVILSWICAARLHAEAFPSDGAIKKRVASISKSLGELGRLFWPGSVMALQLKMQPTELSVQVLGRQATSWSDAAVLAERAIQGKQERDDQAGRDAYGWADGHSHTLSLSLSQASADLKRLGEQIEESTGPIVGSAESEKNCPSPGAEDFRRWVRELRFLRTAPVDPLAWVRLAGRLRWWAQRPEPALTAGAKELESGYLPPRPWAEELGYTPTDLAPSLQENPAPLTPKELSGKRMVFVSHVRDSQLRDALLQTFTGCELSHCMLEPGRLAALAQSIDAKEYDFVFGAFGFLASRTDESLAQSCKKQGVPYLRVNRGHPNSCQRALARVFSQA